MQLVKGQVNIPATFGAELEKARQVKAESIIILLDSCALSSHAALCYPAPDCTTCV